MTYISNLDDPMAISQFHVAYFQVDYLVSSGDSFEVAKHHMNIGQKEGYL